MLYWLPAEILAKTAPFNTNEDLCVLNGITLENITSKRLLGITINHTISWDIRGGSRGYRAYLLIRSDFSDIVYDCICLQRLTSVLYSFKHS